MSDINVFRLSSGHLAEQQDIPLPLVKSSQALNVQRPAHSSPGRKPKELPHA
jgi:hypothetical protein